MRWRTCFAATVAFFSLAAQAAAEPGASETSPDPDGQPAKKRDRFHMALGVGPGFFYATSGKPDDSRRFLGGSVSGQLMVGGRIGRRFVLGGAYLRDQIFALSSKDAVRDGDEPDLSDISFVLSAFGVAGDVYLREEGGPHVQLFLGVGSLAVHGRSQQDVDEPSGVLMSGGFGYDFWSSDAMALGALLRVNWAQFEVRETFTGVDVNGFVPALLLTGTLN